jgi:hypothetical protein
MGRSTALVTTVALLVTLIAPANAAVRLESDTDIATAGYFQLRWEAGETPTRLIESQDPDFETRNLVYEGPDTARLISGKSNGRYFYRLEGPQAAGGTDGREADVVSNTLQVTVRHHSRARALTFFAIGAAVFAATLALVLFGGRNERRQ